MEKFLKDYVKMYAESSEVELNREQVATIVNRLMNNDVVWEVLDEHIRYEFEEMEPGVDCQ